MRGRLKGEKVGLKSHANIAASAWTVLGKVLSRGVK